MCRPNPIGVGIGIIVLSCMFLLGQEPWPPCADLDGDGYGDPASFTCPHPELDCDDTAPYVNPGMAEDCFNQTDDDCDGLVDFPDCPERLDPDFYDLSSGFAMIMNYEEIRLKLLDLIFQSPSYEKIIDLFDFFRAEVYDPSQGSYRKISEYLEDSIGARADEIINDFTANSLDVDLYFPIPDHRTIWQGDTNILVAYSPLWLPEEEMDTVIAHNLPGEEIFLPVGVVPEIPTLVVTLCEHDSIHESTADAEIRVMDFTGSASRMEYFYGIILYNDHEPLFPCGAPEIYVQYKAYQGGLYQRFNLPDVDEERVWYYPRLRIFYWYPDQYGYTIPFGIFEQDWGGTISFNLFGLYVLIKSGDDFLGGYLVNWHDPNRARYDTGDTSVYMAYQWE